jgi:DNA modification methylase
MGRWLDSLRRSASKPPAGGGLNAAAGGTHSAGNWPAWNVQRKPIGWLKPNPRNAKKHGPEQIAQLRAAFRQFGWTMPVLARDDGMIIAGHGRVEAAKLEGFTEAPVVIPTGWTVDQFRAYALADNRIAENSDWDEELLALELADLKVAGVDLSLDLGFSAKELTRILAPPPTPGQNDPNAAPDKPEAPISRAGDVWICGRHRVLCGDSTKAADVARALADAKPGLMVTDPPFGVDYDPAWRDDQAAKAPSLQSGIGNRADGKAQNDGRADWREAWSHFRGNVAYVWHAALKTDVVIASLEATGLLRRSNIVWNKNKHAISRGHYHWSHESCWYVVRKGESGNWQGDRTQQTVWDIANMAGPDGRKEDTISGHGTQKPIDCMRRPIINSSAAGETVYDPFCGSGTTIIACEQSGRVAIGIDIDPAYVDVAVKRWQSFAGEKATLENDGRTFDAIAVDRGTAAAAAAA